MSKSVALDSPSASLLDALVGTGRYGSESEVVGEALRLLSSREAQRIARLRQAWREGVESGDYQPAETVFARLRDRYRMPDSDA